MLRSFNFNLDLYRADLNAVIEYANKLSHLCTFALQLSGRLRASNDELLSELNEMWHAAQQANNWRRHAEHLEQVLCPESDDDPMYRDVCQLAAWGER